MSECVLCHVSSKNVTRLTCCGRLICHSCTSMNGLFWCPFCSQEVLGWATKQKILNEKCESKDTLQSAEPKRRKMTDSVVEDYHEPLRRSRTQCLSENSDECKVISVKVRCKNSTKGCNWTGDLKELEEHLRAKPGKRSRVSGCNYQLISCKECDEDVMYLNLSDHINNSCEKRTLCCDYKFAGCGFQGPAADMPSHNTSSMSKHLRLITNLVKSNSLRQQQLKQQLWWWYVFCVFVVAALVFLIVLHIYLPLSSETCGGGDGCTVALKSHLKAWRKRLDEHEKQLERLKEKELHLVPRASNHEHSEPETKRVLCSLLPKFLYSNCS